MKAHPVPRRRAFSLVELLTVIAIIAILAGLSIGAFNNFAESTRLVNGAEMVSAGFHQARLMALSRNGTTEFRLIADSVDQPPRSFQTVLIKNDGSTLPLTRLHRLPDGVTIASSLDHSGLLSIAPRTIPAGEPQAGRGYYGIRFGIRGEPRDATGTLLGETNNFLTLVAERAYRENQLPPNWITLRIDDRTGAVRRFQP
jgi:uncharacterized protein (TIGR02596 family)